MSIVAYAKSFFGIVIKEDELSEDLAEAFGNDSLKPVGGCVFGTVVVQEDRCCFVAIERTYLHTDWDEGWVKGNFNLMQDAWEESLQRACAKYNMPVTGVPQWHLLMEQL